jgi:hypothetical protein
LGADAPFEEIDDLMEKAAKWAKELAVFKHAKIQAMRLASDPNAPVLPESMTLEELPASIEGDIARLFERGVQLSLPGHVNGNGKEAVRVLCHGRSEEFSISERRSALWIFGSPKHDTGQGLTGRGLHR